MDNAMIGQTVSHYKILEKLGEGGMGVVYKAHDTTLNRLVALKFLHTLSTRNEENRKRFITEAQAASALDHHNICNIHEIDESKDGEQFICMAYYDGENLADKIKKGSIQFEEALDIFCQIAQGLERAHQEKIVHMDVKPSNIIISKEWNVKILDFGLAKLIGNDLTQTISTKGTVAYMAPEVIRGMPVDHRADMWSLGIIFFEMLTGHLPFEGNYSEPLMYSIVNTEPKSLSKYLSKIPDSLQNIIDKLLQKDSQKRYRNLSDVLSDIEPLLKETGSVFVRNRPTISMQLSRKKAYLYGSFALLLFLFFLIIGKPYLFPERSAGNSIAVLPLESITQDSEHEWFTDGMTDALITQLAQISGLRVISRSSSIQYKGTNKAVQAIATELDVEYLVDGSVVKMGEQIKVSARLINALEDEYIWAKEYEREFINALGVHGEIATAIAGQIKVKLTPQEEKRLTEKRPVNPKTYELYLKGMYHLNKYTPAGIEKGLNYLHKAVENDPEEPLAHAALALGYGIIAHTPSPPPYAVPRERAAALKAMELDENIAEVHLALAMIKVYTDWDRVGAEQAYQRTMELNANLALTYPHYGFLMSINGEEDEALAAMKRSQELDPLFPGYPAWQGWLHFWLGQNDAAVKEAMKSLELVPDFPIGLYILGCAYAAKGMYDEAITVHKKAGKISSDFGWALGQTYALAGRVDEALAVAAELESQPKVWDTWGIAEIYTALGDKDKAFYWLEEAYKQKHPYIQWIKVNSSLTSLHDDPRFIDLARRLNLPE